MSASRNRRIRKRVAALSAATLVCVLLYLSLTSGKQQIEATHVVLCALLCLGTILAILTSAGRKVLSDFMFDLRHWKWSDPFGFSSTAGLIGVVSLLLVCVCLTIGTILCVATGTLPWAMETYGDIYPLVLKVGSVALLAVLMLAALCSHDPQNTKGSITTKWYDQHGGRQEATRSMSRAELRAEIDRQDTWINRCLGKVLPPLFLLAIVVLVGSLLSVCSATGWASVLFPDKW